MGGIVSFGVVITPMVREISEGSSGRAVFGIACMGIFTLSINYLTKSAALADLLNFKVSELLWVIFGKHIDRVTLFGSANESHALGQSAASQSLGIHMNTALKALYGILCMLVEIVCQDNCVHIVFNK